MTTWGYFLSAVPNPGDDFTSTVLSNTPVPGRHSPSVLIDVAPMVFATSLARILSGLGYAVELHGDPADHDLTLVSRDPNGAAPGLTPDRVEIALLQPEGHEGLARITGRGWDQEVELRNLDDLLHLINSVVRPERDRPPGSRAVDRIGIGGD